MNHPKYILERYGIRSKKSLGQHFLHDAKILENLVALAELTARDTVLEIGPGLGHLTRHLAWAAGSVISVEIDGRLMPILRDTLSGYHNLELVHGDILEWDYPAKVPTDFKVVANLPYYITGAVLRRLFETRRRPSLTVLTIQKEVSERLTAEPGQMSRLSTSVQLFATVETVLNIKAGSFWPPPDVDSAVVRIRLREEELIKPDEQAAFFRLIRAGFAHKRKMLRKNLIAAGFPAIKLAAAFEEARISGDRRAQELSIDEWVALHRHLD